MRLIATLLLCGVTLTAAAAEIWRWRDANGVVHYTDYPVPGAEKLNLNVPPPPGGGEDAGQFTPMPQIAVPAPRTTQPTYRSCAVVSPQSDETFFSVQPVEVSLSVEPGLQPGHRIIVAMNGAPLSGWPAGSTRYTIPEVFRGSHTLAVRIVDENGRQVCNSQSITFHLRQTSVLPPANQAPPPPRPPGG